MRNDVEKSEEIETTQGAYGKYPANSTAEKMENVKEEKKGQRKRVKESEQGENAYDISFFIYV